MFKYTIMFIIFISLAGCTQLQQKAAVEGSKLAAEVKLADLILQEGKVEDIVLKAKATPNELKDLQDAQETYEEVREQLKQYVDEPILAVNAVSDLKGMHVKLYSATQTVKQFVVNNWEQYTPSQKSMLSEWFNLAKKLDDQYAVFIIAAENAKSEQIKNSATRETLLVIAKMVAAGV